MVYADDFHRSYKNPNASSIKTFNFSDLNRIPLKIKIISDVTTKKNLTEGQKLIFLTTEDAVLSHKKVLAAGSRVIGTIESVSPNGRQGIPANMVVGNFKIEYMPTIKIEGQIIKQGANRAIWVKPLLPLLFAVKGGHAKIKETETYEVYYTPTTI